jgi:autophagy-related protein 9
VSALADREVHAEFGTLFQLKIQVFFTELLSVLLTPWILFFSLPPCSATIIDFFREFSLHVDGIGYVCSFAVFDFQRHGTVNAGEAATSATPADGQDVKGDGPKMTKTTAVNTGARTRQRDHKMEKSFLHFKATHPDWQPDINGSMFLDKVSALHPRARATGVGARGEERSESYDRAWAKGSHLLRSRAGRGRLHPQSELYERGSSSRLATMREREDEVEDEVDELSWNKQVKDDDEGEEEGFMRDAGMVGLLQQVLKR